MLGHRLPTLGIMNISIYEINHIQKYPLFVFMTILIISLQIDVDLFTLKLNRVDLRRLSYPYPQKKRQKAKKRLFQRCFFEFIASKL